VFGLKVFSLDSVVYELVDALILLIISSSVLRANRVIGLVLFTPENRYFAHDIYLTPPLLHPVTCP